MQGLIFTISDDESSTPTTNVYSDSESDTDLNPLMHQSRKPFKEVITAGFSFCDSEEPDVKAVKAGNVWGFDSAKELVMKKVRV